MAVALRAGSRFANLLPRVLTAIVGLPIFLLALWTGRVWWAALVAVIMIAGAFEYVRLCPGLKSGRQVVLLAGVAGLAGLVAWGPVVVVPWGIALAGAIIVVVGLVPLVAGGGLPGLVRVEATWSAVPMGIAYLGAPAGVLVRWRDQHFAVVMILFGIVWANDVAGYFIGSRYGRHKLAPRISPGKSWEGSVAGLLIGGAIGVVSGSFLGLSLIGGALLGVLISATAQIGDLFESALKRAAGVKDSGGIFPGHGGMLDRFDGVFFAAPVGFAFFQAWTP